MTRLSFDVMNGSQIDGYHRFIGGRKSSPKYSANEEI